MSYETITSTEAADAFIAADAPGWLLKHSNACGISFAAMEQFEKHTAAHDDQRAGVVVIQEHRPVSNHVAEQLGRVHQSPQLFLVHAGEVLWTATHYSITAEAMAAAWQEQTASG